MGDAYCTECKKNTDVVFDHSAGDTVCSECGLVLESHSIDETSEWRTFANEAGDNDPNRVGGPSNPLLNEGSLTTVISKANGASGGDNFPRWQNRGSNPERTLVLAFKNIAVMSDRLGLVPTIKVRLALNDLAPMQYVNTPRQVQFLPLVFKRRPALNDLAPMQYANTPRQVQVSYTLEGYGGDLSVLEEDLYNSVAESDINLSFRQLSLIAINRANEIYKKVEDQKSIRGRNQEAILAACLYIACRQEDKPRTVKEICSVVNGATKKEIGRAKEYIVKQLELEDGKAVEMGTIHAADFLKRFGSHLNMSIQAVKAAEEAVKKSEELDIRRSPISVAAAVIYIITQLSEQKKILRDISNATGVAEGTIRNSYKDLHPYASRIIPSWYAKEEDIRNLCSP
ncbi:hypothetical protein GIB67_032067 [Kingdonia uniflora]|uniref:TFIIB-type domain-containing protein n=1 Tax=Kingdonia uniflora TaxID=39325 RepID=A0A7J7MWN9_9MAGN|nr:hypothetical protein GIB67_032067 [Kingdonia uniflora]